MQFKNKEQLAHYLLQGHIHLSKKDYGFFNNIFYQAQQHRPITTNQDKLFNKLLAKYKRQLTKIGFDIEELSKVTWRADLVETKSEFLEAKISYVNENIIIKLPFNTRFIQEFRKADYNKFEWDNKNRYYIAPFSTYSLKLAMTHVAKHYETIKLCDTINEALYNFNNFKNTDIWNPTLINVSENFYIVGINESLHDAIKDIELNGDPKTLFLLSQYGVQIDKSVTKNDSFLEFAGSFEVNYDLNNLTLLAEMLKLLNVEHVFTSRDLVYTKQISNEVKITLSNYGITCSPLSQKQNSNGVVLNTFKTDIDKRVQKVITLSNSRPILVK